MVLKVLAAQRKKNPKESWAPFDFGDPLAWLDVFLAVLVAKRSVGTSAVGFAIEFEGSKKWKSNMPLTQIRPVCGTGSQYHKSEAMESLSMMKSFADDSGGASRSGTHIPVKQDCSLLISLILIPFSRCSLCSMGRLFIALH